MTRRPMNMLRHFLNTYALMIHRCHARLFWGAENNARLLEEAKANHTTYVATGLNTPSQNNAAETEV